MSMCTGSDAMFQPSSSVSRNDCPPELPSLANYIMNCNSALYPIMKRGLSGWVLACLLMASACKPGDPLPGGYAIFYGDSEDVGLVLPPKGEMLVGPKLVGIGNSGTVIFGEVQAPKKPFPNLLGSRTPGYFIVNTTTGAIELGLSREEWKNRLSKLGVEGEPELVAPERKGPQRR
jgi:hypothetical protein